MLREGLWTDRWVRIRYGSRERTVAPLGLVAKGRDWYLVAAGRDGRIHTYRVSRVGGAAVTEEQFDRPAGFDLAAHWEETRERFFAGLRDYPVRLRVRSDVVRRLYWEPNVAIERVVARPDGWSEVSANFEKAYETRVYLLGLAGDVVVEEPAELRAAMTKAARALLAHHRE